LLPKTRNDLWWRTTRTYMDSWTLIDLYRYLDSSKSSYWIRDWLGANGRIWVRIVHKESDNGDRSQFWYRNTIHNGRKEFFVLLAMLQACLHP
jgi:hypothetical protein